MQRTFGRVMWTRETTVTKRQKKTWQRRDHFTIGKNPTTSYTNSPIKKRHLSKRTLNKYSVILEQCKRSHKYSRDTGENV
jgi:hypothetical protein